MSDTAIGETPNEAYSPIVLRITYPGGGKLTVSVPPSTTVGQLKEELFEAGSPPGAYLRLVCRGKKLEDDAASLESLGIQSRTAIMALHNEQFVQDQAGVQAIEKVLSEADQLQQDRQLPKNVVTERVTQLFCQLDGIEINGSATLRQFRKSALSRIQKIEQNWGRTTLH
jgi:hypothetical protein